MKRRPAKSIPLAIRLLLVFGDYPNRQARTIEEIKCQRRVKEAAEGLKK